MFGSMQHHYPLPNQHPQITARLEQGVLTLRLGTDQAPLALDVPAIELLNQLFWQVAQDPQVRVLVLRGQGRHFGLGLDIQDMESQYAQQPSRVHQALYALRQWGNGQLRRMPQAVLALIQGQCAGAAITLVQGCDIALSEHGAQFSFTAADAHWLALEPAAQPRADWLSARALHFHCVSGQAASGLEAERMGLVTFSHPEESLDEALSDLVTSLGEKDPLALQFTKETLAHVGSMSWDAAVSYTAAKFAEIKARQADRPSTRASAIAGFLAGKNKPGLSG